MTNEMKIEIARAKAEAFSSAADTACNEWNGHRRTKAWANMTPKFQKIWKNLKNISHDYHQEVKELEKENSL